MSARHYIIATAGHVDHGKSSLVKALTGTDPDRLPEEKARQITIDLGFAELKLRDDIHAAIVDVPGHEDFVRNMIAGVGSIDLALLVVAADDGWMPQTEEHLQILEYLGVKRAIACLTKSDIGDADKVEEEIRQQLGATIFADSRIVRTSKNSLGELRSTLVQTLEKMQPAPDYGKPRLFVDRVFILRGIGTVATGTLIGGTLARGQSIVVRPANISARIRSIQSHNHDVDLALPGTRVALNLPDLRANLDINRGDVITVSGFAPSTIFDVILERSPRLRHAPPLKEGGPVYLHHGTKRVRAKVFPRKGQVHLETPILGFLGDRFVLRDASEQHTIAGGIIAPKNVPPNDVDLSALSEITRAGAMHTADVLRNSHFSTAEIGIALDRLAKQQKIFLGKEFAVAMAAWQQWQKEAAGLVDAHHQQHPEKSGIELSELRACLTNITSEIFDEVVVDLATNDFRKVASVIGRRTHRPQLSAVLRADAEKILHELAQKPFDPPNQSPNAALRFLVESGEVVELAPTVFVRQDAFAEMKARIVSALTNRRATLSVLRQALGTSRRIAVPLLELLDRQGVTRRFGDERALR